MMSTVLRRGEPWLSLPFGRGLHASPRLLGRWSETEDQLLLNKYAELGPAWTVLSLAIASRSPVECRRRWLMLSGSLEGLGPEARRLVYEEGYEWHQGRLIKIPMERVVAGPMAKLAAGIPPVRFRSQRRKGGWCQMERVAVQEGLEQYGPNWKLIAAKLQYRSPTQCRNMMLRRSILWNLDIARRLPQVKTILASGSQLLVGDAKEDCNNS